MNFPVTYIKTFFEEPEKILNFSKTLEYFKPKENENWKGTRSKPLHEINYKLFKFIIEKVLAIYYDYNLENVVWRNTHVSFHKINKDTVVNDIHKDTDAVLAGVIYLNKTGDLTNGTTIYEDKKEILKIANHFNSMVCYDAKQLHGITNSFLKEEERLVIVFFIDILEVNLTPLERCNRVQNEF